MSTELTLEKNNDVTRVFLRIIDTSFPWYVFAFLSMLFIDVVSDGWLAQLNISIESFIWFIVVSGILKILYRAQEIRAWFSRTQNRIKQRSFLVWSLARFLRLIEYGFEKLSWNILEGGSIFERLPILWLRGFSWFFIVYLILLVIEEMKEGWVQTQLHVNIDTIFIYTLFAGGIALFLNNRAVSSSSEKNFSNVATKNFYIKLIVILAFLGAMILYWRVREISQIGLFVSIISGVVFFLLMYLLVVSNEDVIKK